MLTEEQAAKLTGLTMVQLRELVRQGKLTAHDEDGDVIEPDDLPDLPQ